MLNLFKPKRIRLSTESKDEAKRMILFRAGFTEYLDHRDIVRGLDLSSVLTIESETRMFPRPRFYLTETDPYILRQQVERALDAETSKYYENYSRKKSDLENEWRKNRGALVDAQLKLYEENWTECFYLKSPLLWKNFLKEFDTKLTEARKACAKEADKAYKADAAAEARKATEAMIDTLLKETVDRNKILHEIAVERERQVKGEGYSPERDDKYVYGDLAKAGATFAFVATHRYRNEIVDLQKVPFDSCVWKCGFGEFVRNLWPWNQHNLKFKSPKEDLIKAAALIVAEIERLERSELAKKAK